MYNYIEHVLASYLNSDLEQSEDEAMALLQKHLDNSDELAKGLSVDLNGAFSDASYSWMRALSENNVIHATDEQEARAYALSVFSPLLVSR